MSGKGRRAALVVAIAAACSGSGSGSATGSGSSSGSGSASATGSGSGSATGSGSSSGSGSGSGSDSLLAMGEGGEPAAAAPAAADEPDEEGGGAAQQESDDKKPDAAVTGAVAVAADSLAAFGYTVDEKAAKAGGTVRVIVRWPDTPQGRRASPGENECGKPRLPSVAPDELWGIGEAVVLLDVTRGKAPGPLSPVGVAMESCALTPRLAVTRPGTSLFVANRDAAVRAAKLRTRAWKSAKKLEAAAAASAQAKPVRLPWRGHRVEIALAEPGFAQVELEGKHGAEDAAWIAVVPSPYAAVTDKAGGASFTQVPAGEVAVTVWIPARGGGKAVELSGKVAVKGGQTAELVLTP